MPVIDVYVVIAEGSFVKVNCNLLFFAGLKEYLLEALKLSVSLINCAFGRTYINLSNLSACNITDVFKCEGN